MVEVIPDAVVTTVTVATPLGVCAPATPPTVCLGFSSVGGECAPRPKTAATTDVDDLRRASSPRSRDQSLLWRHRSNDSRGTVEEAAVAEHDH